MQIKILLHEADIDKRQDDDGSQEVTIAVGAAQQIACKDNGLHRHIEKRNHDVRHAQLVGHNLIEMLAVRQSDVLVKHQPMDDGQHAIHAIDRQEDYPTEVFRPDNQPAYEEKQDESDAHRTDIACETLRPAAEVEETEHQHRTDDRTDEVFLHKRHDLAIDIRQCREYHQRIAARDAVDAIHEVVGIDDSRADNQGYDEPPPSPREQSPLPEHQCHGRELNHKPHFLRDGMHIIYKTDARHHRQRQHEPRILEAVGQEVSQCSEVEDDSSTSERDARVRTPLIGLVDDVALVRNAEIKQLCRKEQNKEYQIVHHDLSETNDRIVLLTPSSALIGIFAIPKADLILALLTT